MKLFNRGAFAAIVTSTLVACGGGGGGSDSEAAGGVNSAVGSWEGTTTDGESIGTVVLDTGEVWGLVASGSNAFAVFHAPSSSTSGNSFSASQPRIYEFGSGAHISGTLTGTVNSSSFSGTASGTGGSVGFNMAADASYSTPAVLSSAVGTWDGSFGDLTGAQSISGVTVSSGGAVAVTVGTCSLTGTIQPRPGVGVYNVTLRYRVASGCLADADVSGIGVVSDDLTRLVIGVINSDRSNAGLAVLTKRVPI